MKLKIKCETPKEQVLVLRKFKKLVPECRWAGGKPIAEHIPFVDNNTDAIMLFLIGSIVGWGNLSSTYYSDYPTFTASEFLKDDWKLEDEPTDKLKKMQSLIEQLYELGKEVEK